jgi:carbon-monoxide dehydrogenase medium subunit
VKAPSFAYAKPATLAEALDLLVQPGAKLLAGGQSLIPALNLRLDAPALLVDIGGLAELKKIELAGSVVRVGALVTHTQLEKSDVIAKHLPLLAQAVPHVAHPAIRNRGTLGGSLALADPAAEYPACAVALQATLVLQSRAGRRKVAAESFFKGLYETDLKAGEVLVAAEFPAQKAGDRSAFLELARRHGDYAIVGLAAHNDRFVFFGVGSKPCLVKAKGDLSTLEINSDLYHSAATKRHLAGVLMDRAWTTRSTSR